MLVKIYYRIICKIIRFYFNSIPVDILSRITNYFKKYLINGFEKIYNFFNGNWSKSPSKF